MQICPAILQQIVQCHADIVLILTKVEHCDAVTYADVGGVYILLAANGAEAAVTTVIDVQCQYLPVQIADVRRAGRTLALWQRADAAED